MKGEEGLNLADLAVFTCGGKHLSSLEKNIFHSSWEGQSYSEMATNYHLNPQYIRNKGSELWNKLSVALGEKVNKNNFKEALKRYAPKLYRDLKEAPDVSVFYGRTYELATLESWILQDKCRLITLLGMPGIGKTALATQITAQVQRQFEYVIWRTLELNPPSLTELLADLIEFFSLRRGLTTFKPVISQLMDFFYSHRCLVVLDGVEKLQGPDRQYLANYENYGCLFKRVGEVNHQSCLLLTSREKPPQIQLLECTNHPVRSFRILGLDPDSAQKILTDQGFPTEWKWDSIIELYGGNPLFLQLARHKLQKHCLSSNQILTKTNYLIFEQIGVIIDDIFSRLSDWENQVMVKLAQAKQPLSIEQIFSTLELPNYLIPIELLESLYERSLLEKQELVTETLFSIQPLIVDYVKLFKLINP
ncbi:MAG: NACHT domain-containing protein [Gomphosphaeria aponina SAG 52.96 = DSM 107014]|uniref:NACHT domain-containing protein n=1 Tax=Gomphosphaeria aponina SAG 52.96 = DSM 107014 TaxID=1521640 RepID=A0A941GYJ2_9CHRO|nr:NACHT domain-containing protein [Gomphosphaeria aponina SAG 52.96 = DSM 107014]